MYEKMWKKKGTPEMLSMTHPIMTRAIIMEWWVAIRLK
jgi:hypothetical protein